MDCYRRDLLGGCKLDLSGSTLGLVGNCFDRGNEHLTSILTYLITPWSRVLLEQLTGSAASQEIPCIFGTRRFITVLTSARHLSLS